MDKNFDKNWTKGGWEYVFEIKSCYGDKRCIQGGNLRNNLYCSDGTILIRKVIYLD